MGNKRTARLLINFLTMKEGFPLFTYEDKGAFFNSLLVTSYTEGKAGLIEEFIAGALTDRMESLLTEHRQAERPKIQTIIHTNRHRAAVGEG